jgi:hypothetical protein
MSNVAIRNFIQKVYKPIAAWINTNVATKTELGQNADEHLHPVDISSLTPSSTFGKNSVIGINGVLYRATKATSNMPVTLTVLNGAFVYHSVNGKIAFVVSDETLNSDWEIFTDASIEYWVASLNAALANKQDSIDDLSTIRSNATGAVKKADTYTYNNQSYTVDSMLTELAKFMSKTVVTQG